LKDKERDGGEEGLDRRLPFKDDIKNYGGELRRP